MVMWSVSFPAADVLMQSWGAVSLVTLRQILAVSVLCAFWIAADGWKAVTNAPWWQGIRVGGIGFGVGATLLLVGQKFSDPVTPAIAAAMMPIAGAALEVLFDGRRLKLQLLIGIVLALSGGLLATGVRLNEGTFGIGALLCFLATCFYGWGTRSTALEFAGMSNIGRTTITLIGGMVCMVLVSVVLFVAEIPGVEIGLLDASHIGMILVFAWVSLAAAQLLWIRGVTGLGILLGSFHMNAVPFYVMVFVVLFLEGEWQWMQAAGAGLVCVGVMISQMRFKKRSR